MQTSAGTQMLKRVEFADRFADELVRLVGNDEDALPVTRERAFEMGETTYDPASAESPETIAMGFYMCGDR